MDANDYRLPGSNRITFSNQLADEIRERFATDRDNRSQLFLLAAGLRKKYLNKKTHTMPKIFLRNLSLLILILKSLKVWKRHYKLYIMKKHTFQK